MLIEVKIPSPGESVSEAEIGSWFVSDGDLVEKGQEIAEVESEKATLPLIAGESGEIHIIAQEGEAVAIGSVACTIDTEKAVSDQKPESSAETAVPETETTVSPIQKEEGEQEPVRIKEPEKKKEPKEEEKETDKQKIKVTPAARSVMEEEGLLIDDVLDGLRRITRKDVETVISNSKQTERQFATREEERSKMTALRRKLSERLVAGKNQMAMLTTFNEADMSKIVNLRKNYQQSFIDKYGYKVGYMSFFTKAVSIALKIHPALNSMIEGEDVVFPHYHDIGIAVQTPKGLMVPVIRNAEIKSIPVLENEIQILAEKARNKKLTVEEMSGGTFTITNGGIFGSLLSTPLINPPQSSILGMHSIKERPVAIDGKVTVRPMMYLALSYDHRLIDGKDSVGFLLKVKELIENPEQMLLEGKSAEEALLGL